MVNHNNWFKPMVNHNIFFTISIWEYHWNSHILGHLYEKKYKIYSKSLVSWGKWWQSIGCWGWFSGASFTCQGLKLKAFDHHVKVLTWERSLFHCVDRTVDIHIYIYAIYICYHILILYDIIDLNSVRAMFITSFSLQLQSFLYIKCKFWRSTSSRTDLSFLNQFSMGLLL
jgi:hypothetical protein